MPGRELGLWLGRAGCRTRASDQVTRSRRSLHNAAYAALGLTGWMYEAIDCAEADLSGLLAAHPNRSVGRLLVHDAAQAGGARAGGRGRPARGGGRCRQHAAATADGRLAGRDDRRRWHRRRAGRGAGPLLRRDDPRCRRHRPGRGRRGGRAPARRGAPSWCATATGREPLRATAERLGVRRRRRRPAGRRGRARAPIWSSRHCRRTRPIGSPPGPGAPIRSCSTRSTTRGRPQLAAGGREPRGDRRQRCA